MKQYSLPFDYTDNPQLAHKKGIGKIAHSTPKGYQKWLEREAFGLTYYLTDAQLGWFKEHGDPKPPTFHYAQSENMYQGQDMFIVCPGPSVKDTLPKPDILADKLSVAVNSGWFYAKTRYWMIAEAHYMRWLCQHDAAWHAKYYARYAQQDFLVTARAAIWWWKNGPGRAPGTKRVKSPYKGLYLLRHEECGAVPMPVEGVSVFNAIATAWWFGCKRAILIGLDLSKPGMPYVEGVPYDQHGAANPYDHQVTALRQVQYPGLEIINASPHSAERLPFRSIGRKELNEMICQ